MQEVLDPASKPELKPFVPATEENTEPKPVSPTPGSSTFVPVKEEKPTTSEASPAAEAIAKRDRKVPRRNFAFHPAPIQTEEAKAEDSAFARGLPEWSIEPPQVVVRRKRR